MHNDRSESCLQHCQASNNIPLGEVRILINSRECEQENGVYSPLYTNELIALALLCNPGDFRLCAKSFVALERARA